MSELPPPIPKEAAAPQQLPPAGPSRIKVVLFSIVTTGLFLLNAGVSLLAVLPKDPSAFQISYVIGYVLGNAVMPPVIIISIASLWKCNRRPYVMLQWFFWITMLGILSKIAMAVSAATHSPGN